ncbi:MULTISPECIES: alpha/beta hydrolase [Burkholderia]|uniref:alpha/beta hydrolase n=1 Tax=Burkholderia TaxID=32008 RepID=UPI00070622DD|nr:MULTISPECIES: hypothetical protein [Burkholderia]ALK30094.1 phospholipase/carboxylesterase [Burkholderia plantarii]MDN7755290.1 phospholipase [Burkholderia gladioli]GLZ23182.1 phospholipase/carboxylesterase [Burkholderia plantarii]
MNPIWKSLPDGTALHHFGVPLAEARLAVIVIHGRTQTPGDMFEAIVGKLNLRKVAYIAPAASGNSWYPNSFMAPLESNQPQLDDAIASLATISASLCDQGFDLDRQVLVGFSQGACLATEYLWRKKERYGALAALTGGLIGPQDMHWEASGNAFSAMPMFFSNGDQDQWVPLSRTLESIQVMRAHGAQIIEKCYPGRPHEVCADEIGHLQRMLEGILEKCGVA